MKKFVTLKIFVAGVLAVSAALAQDVRDTSYVTQTGERVLRLETTVPTPAQQVWEAFTTQKGLQGWIAPVAAIDLKVGGKLSTNYNAKATLDAPGTIHLKIINYIEHEIITFKVTLNGSFAQKARDEDQDLQEIVQIVDLGRGKTKIVSSMIGWGTGKEWDDTYQFFRRGNLWTYQQLIKYLCPGCAKS